MVAPIARASGVREASGEETAGRLRSVAPLAMGIVAPAVVGSARLSEVRGLESLGARDGARGEGALEL